MLSGLDSQEDEPTQDDLVFYYGLSHNRDSDDCMTVGFTSGCIGAFLGALFFAPWGFLGGFIAPLLVPLLAIIGAVLGWTFGALIVMGFTAFVRYFSSHSWRTK